MLVIPVVDGTAKYLSTSYSPLFISWARYAVACMIVLPIAFFYCGRSIFPKSHLLAHFMRTVCLVAAMSLYFMAISRIPLSLALSAYFIGPIVAVVLSILFLGEQLTPQKAISLLLGVVGSLVIIRPTGGFEPGLLLAFGAGLLFALYLITTRSASQHSDPLKTLAFQCFVGAILLSPQGIIFYTPLQPKLLWLFAALGLFSVIGHVLTIKAFRLAGASMLAPLVYVELVGTVLIGYFIFSEIPSLVTAVGSTLIVLAGLILIRRSSG